MSPSVTCAERPDDGFGAEFAVNTGADAEIPAPFWAAPSFMFAVMSAAVRSLNAQWPARPTSDPRSVL